MHLTLCWFIWAQFTYPQLTLLTSTSTLSSSLCLRAAFPANLIHVLILQRSSTCVKSINVELLFKFSPASHLQEVTHQQREIFTFRVHDQFIEGEMQNSGKVFVVIRNIKRGYIKVTLGVIVAYKPRHVRLAFNFSKNIRISLYAHRCKKKYISLFFVRDVSWKNYELSKIVV